MCNSYCRYKFLQMKLFFFIVIFKLSCWSNIPFFWSKILLLVIAYGRFILPLALVNKGILVCLHWCMCACLSMRKRKGNDGIRQMSIWYTNHCSCLIANTFIELAWTCACVCTHTCLCMFACVCVYPFACVQLRYVFMYSNGLVVTQ